MVKGLINKLNKEKIEYSLANPEHSISEISEYHTKYFGESVNPSEFEYSHKRGAAHYIEQPKSLWDKFKDWTAMLTFVSVLGLAGCNPYIEPPEEPTPTEQTAEPTATPTSEPTQTPEPTPTPTPEPDYIDISGYLEDETGMGRNGVVRFYNANDPDVVEGNYLTEDILKETTTCPNGNFSATLNQLVSELPDGVVIRGITGSNWNDKTSYVNIITVPQGDQSGVSIIATMYDNPNYSSDDGLLDTEQKRIDFKEQMGRVNFWGVDERYNVYDFLNAQLLADAINGNPYHGLKKTNFFDEELPDYIQEIEVNSDKYSTDDFDTIYNIIEDTAGPIAPIIASKLTYGNSHQNTTGWGSITDSDGIGPYIVLRDQNQNGYVDKFVVHLNTLAPEIVRHELLHHGEGNEGHSNGKHSDGSYIPELFPSIGQYSSPSPSNNTAFDIKKEYIIKAYPGMEHIDNTLGL